VCVWSGAGRHTSHVIVRVCGVEWHMARLMPREKPCGPIPSCKQPRGHRVRLARIHSLLYHPERPAGIYLPAHIPTQIRILAQSLTQNYEMMEVCLLSTCALCALLMYALGLQPSAWGDLITIWLSLLRRSWPILCTHIPRLPYKKITGPATCICPRLHAIAARNRLPPPAPYSPVP
jgi:hypothetical protein